MSKDELNIFLSWINSKLVTFQHRRSYPELLQIVINGCSLRADRALGAYWDLKSKHMPSVFFTYDPSVKMNGCSHREPCAFGAYWDLHSTQISSGNFTYVPSLKMLLKMVVPSTFPPSTCIILLFSSLTTARRDRTWSIIVIYEQEIVSVYFLDRDYIRLRVLVGNALFSTLRPSSISISMRSFQMNYSP